jgi:hypothetical protein
MKSPYAKSKKIGKIFKKIRHNSYHIDFQTDIPIYKLKFLPGIQKKDLVNLHLEQ